MTNSGKRIEVGLIRRLQLIVDTALRRNAKTTLKKNGTSFSFRYLSAKSQYAEKQSFDPSVEIVLDALSIASSFDLNRALGFVDHISKSTKFDVALTKFSLSPDTEPAPERTQVPKSPDYSLFNIDALGKEHSHKIRNCYERELSKIGISLPFGKSDMAKILGILTATRRTKTIKEYSELETLIVSFLRTCWPLFSPRVLSIAFSYLRNGIALEANQHAEYFDLLSRFGFEKLQMRLVILRAVNGDAHAIEFLSEKNDWVAAQLTTNFEASARGYLEGKREFHAIDKESNADNPIALLIQLSMYINCHSGNHDFLVKLVAAHEIDPSVVRFLNWDHLRPQVIAAKKFAVPALIFLASILRQPKVYTNFDYLENKYGPGGAGADIRKVANYHRSELKQNRTQFISSLLKLPRKAATSSLRLLLSAGMIDRIANIYQAEGSTVSLDHKDSLSLALEFRIACLNAMRGRNLISRSEWSLLFNEARTALRKFKYDEKAQAGRLRIRTDSLANEIAFWRKTNEELFSHAGKESDNGFLSSSNEFRAELLADDLAEFLVYRNRLAFDLLLANNLRHFFLSHKIAVSIKEGMHIAFEDDSKVDVLLQSVDNHIDEYCTNWITVHRKRSFFAKLRNELSQLIRKLLATDIRELTFDSDVTRLAVDRFDKLLADCRLAWRAGVRKKVQGEVAKYMETYSEDQMVADRVRLSIDSAIDITESWIAINQTEYPETFLLKDHIFFEAIHLKSSIHFRRSLAVEVAKETRGQILGSNWDIELNSDWIDTIVELVDNLVENACRYSGYRDRTALSILLIWSSARIQIIFTNNLKPEELGKVRTAVSAIRKALVCPITEEALRGRGGTGLLRVRHACSKIAPGSFTLALNEAQLDRGRFELVASFNKINSRLRNGPAESFGS